MKLKIELTKEQPEPRRPGDKRRKQSGSWYCVEATNLPGCVSQGKTIQSALRNIGEAAELWLETYRETEPGHPLKADPKLARLVNAL